MGGVRVTTASEVKALGRCSTAARSLKYSALDGTEALNVKVEVQVPSGYRAGTGPGRNGLGILTVRLSVWRSPQGEFKGMLFHWERAVWDMRRSKQDEAGLTYKMATGQLDMQGTCNEGLQQQRRCMQRWKEKDRA